MLFAAIARLPVGLFVWTCLGLFVGWVAGSVLKGRRNVFGDLVAGLAGGLGTGLVLGLTLSGREAMMVCNGAALVGGAVAVGVWRMLTRPRTV